MVEYLCTGSKEDLSVKIGITLNDDQGLDGEVCVHFGHCRFFGLVDIEGENVKNVTIVPNTAQHGGGGCQAVDAILSYKITHVIAGGMGGGAQTKFSAAGVPVFGYAGKAKDAVQKFLKQELGGLSSCAGHEDGCH